MVQWQNLPKYSFNAKELDEETGMYYYEARYYAPPTFTSRDPLFEKYFWMSPYAYCANNPVKYVDPSGRKIVIVINSQNGSSQQKLYYKRGDLYTDKGCRIYYMDNNSFALGVQSDLKNISSYGGKLDKRLQKMENSRREHRIQQTSGENYIKSDSQEAVDNGIPTGSTIYYKRNKDKVRESRSSLVHELLGHGFSMEMGSLDQSEIDLGNGKKIYKDQIEAINIQNVYNVLVGLEPRTTDGENHDIDVSKYLNLSPNNYDE